MENPKTPRFFLAISEGLVMTPFLQLAIALAIIIFAAKLGGFFSLRLGQPSVLGELLVGVFLGPSVLDLFHIAYFTDEHLLEVIHQLAELGVMFLMFIAGLDLHLEDLAKSGKVAAYVGVLGVIIPLALGVGTGLLFGMQVSPAIFVGLILAATSVSISAQTLMELNVLRSRVGISLLGAAVFDDILVVLGLSVFIALSTPGEGIGLGSIVVIVLRMILFLTLGAVFGFIFLPRLSRKIDQLPISQGVIAFAVVVILFYGWTAEVLGKMAAITGAFLAGLSMSRSPVKERIEHGIATLAYGLFVPIFFINVGLSANARELGGDIFWLFVAMTFTAIVGKILGAGLGAELNGFARRESLQIGVGMMSRGEVGLIVASVGITEGVIGQNIFSAVVGVVIITTLLAPLLLRALFVNTAPAKEFFPHEDTGEEV
jgi:Kef-type K+ transport system membrane component KefB